MCIYCNINQINCCKYYTRGTEILQFFLNDLNAIHYTQEGRKFMTEALHMTDDELTMFMVTHLQKQLVKLHPTRINKGNP